MSIACIGLDRIREGLRSFKRDSRGTAVVELGLLFPFLMGFIAICIQFSLIFLVDLSVMYSARDLARWVAIHPDTVDSTSISSLESRLPSNLDSNKLTVSISPSCSALDSTGRCSSRSVGTQLTVKLTYDDTSDYFFPHPAGFLPTGLSYTAYYAVEVY